MAKIKISIVSYINAIPFLYGINTLKNVIIEKHIPSVCAENLINNNVDIGLVPIAIIPKLNKFSIITDFCIGAVKFSKTVLLLSNVPLTDIKKIYLDKESITSVTLAKILAKKFWKINPIWDNADISVNCKLSTDTAVVAIGDKTFNLSKEFAYNYDLVSEWYNWTGLPFVFACWITNKELPPDFITLFNNALSFGVKHKTEAIKKYLDNKLSVSEAIDYIDNYMNYEFDDSKKKGMELFFSLMKEVL